ncbi:MAG: hypothetical protein KDA36_06300, partial [Planctomycetaceae bacterium]|nr:hypothetical protein [Planctomycetaceae bacterium]
LDDLTPWKVLGKKWHLSRKGFPSNKRVKWEPELLERLASLLDAAASAPLHWDWGNKQVAHAYLSESDTGSPWASIHTKRREGVDLVLSSPAGKFSLGRIAEFGSERSITPSKGKLEQISIRFTSLPQLTPPPLLTFLQDYYAGVTS